MSLLRLSLVEQAIHYILKEIDTKYQALNYYRLDDLLTEDERMVRDLAREVLAAAGITYEFQSGRHMVNLESVFTYEGTHDIHTLVIGVDLTGIEAFR